MDENSLKFIGSFIIDFFYYNYTDPIYLDQVEKYYLKQINYLLSKKIVFKLSEIKNTADYTIKLYLKTATAFDIFYGDTNNMILNTTYYCINENNQIIGPLKIHENHSGEIFRTFLNNNFILVPTKKQLFEPIEIAKAS